MSEYKNIAKILHSPLTTALEIPLQRAAHDLQAAPRRHGLRRVRPLNKTMRRSSKGIALVDNSGSRPKLRYVFDVSDAGEWENSRPVNLWSMREEYVPTGQDALERSYGVEAPEICSEPEDFMDVFDFNTQAASNVFGTAVSEAFS